MSSAQTAEFSSGKTAALIVAAGSGARMGSEIPKQYLRLGGIPLLRHSVEAFIRHPGINRVQVVIHPDHHDFYEEAVQGLPLPPPVPGGATRQESVRRGLEAVASQTPANILIHDAARPFVSEPVISRVIEALAHHPGAIPVLPVVDTLKQVEAEFITHTVDRTSLFRAQTPQGFHFGAIFQAHQLHRSSEFTDDAALAEREGFLVKAIAGEERNFKLTTQEDWQRAQAMLYLPEETRVGQGFDVHRLIPHAAGEKPVIRLCGIDVPFERKLEGHSDADVGLHAAVDAILGALAEGDIGQHFSPADPRWRGADSAQFLLHAQELVKRRGGRIVHLDITIIGERPKISPHREAMRERVAALLALPLHRISIKATTTEKLGFTGREEGLAAQAVATLRLPELGDE